MSGCLEKLQCVGWAKARSCAPCPRRGSDGAKGGRSRATPTRLGSFSESAGHVPDAATPVERQLSARDILVEAAMRAIANPGHLPMFDWIEVNVVNTSLQVVIIANGVFPISTLPNSPLTSANLARAALPFAGKPTRKSAFDRVPAYRKIGIALRQSPDGVQGVRQYADCNCLERIPFSNGSVHASEPIDMPYEEVAPAISKSDGKEKDAAFDFGPTISRHETWVSCIRSRAYTMRWCDVARRVGTARAVKLAQTA
jgi:hypothetical protein